MTKRDLAELKASLKGRQRAFLVAFASSGNITAACEDAKIARRTHYIWMQDEAYRLAFEAAREEANDALELEARRRAMTGVQEPVYQGGKLVGTVTKFSDTLLIFLLKGAIPEKYKERWEGRVSGTLGLAAVDLTPEEEQELRKALIG